MFDAYRKWLGILPKDQPPNCYRLLGLELFEHDLEIIEAAVDRTMGFVRQYQSGEHAAEAAKLLNEIAQARICLLKPESKAQYDAKLKSKIDSSKVADRPAVGPDDELQDVDLNEYPAPPILKKRKKRKTAAASKNPWVWIGAAAGLLLVVMVISKPSQPLAVATIREIPPATVPPTRIAVAEVETVPKPAVASPSTSHSPSETPPPTQSTNQVAVGPAQSDEAEPMKQEVMEVASNDRPEPPQTEQAIVVSRFDRAKMRNRVSQGDMEIPRSQFQKAFPVITPPGQTITLERSENNPHGGKACLHIAGKCDWACVKIVKIKVPPGKTVHGSLWKRANLGGGHFALYGFHNNKKLLEKELYGETTTEWTESHWTLTPADLGNVTELSVELAAGTEFDVYFDDICVWTE